MHRTGIVAKLYLFTFFIFGFYSLSYIQLYRPEITLWDNLWPRVVFNCVPLATIWFIYSRTKISEALKIRIWTLALPLLMSSASCVYVWPLIMQGHWELYLMINTTNVYALSFWFIYGGPSLRQSAYMLALTLVVFWAPLYYVLSETHNASVMHVFLNDNIMAAGINIFSSFTIYSLRRRLAIEDVVSKNEVRKYLGGRVSEAVFEGRADLLADRNQNAFMLSMDLRGYTALMRELDPQHAKKFMEAYHQSINRIVGETGGYIHKTAGDGHLISYGLMDEDVDLSELSNLRAQIESAENRRNSFFFSKAVAAVQQAVQSIEHLNHEFKVKHRVMVGASIDFGNIDVKVVGDDDFRKELDIFGAPIIRAVRLENYSKFVMTQLQLQDSMLIVSAQTRAFSHSPERFAEFSTLGNPVRDYPDLENVYYLTFAGPMARIKAA